MKRKPKEKITIEISYNGKTTGPIPGDEWDRRCKKIHQMAKAGTLKKFLESLKDKEEK